MKRITSKNRRKAHSANTEKRKEAETFNGDFVGIDKEKIALAFPNKEDRINYVRALRMAV
jgi:hypothetical protein